MRGATFQNVPSQLKGAVPHDFCLVLVIVIGQRHNFLMTHCQIAFYHLIVRILKCNMPSIYVEFLPRSTNPRF